MPLPEWGGIWDISSDRNADYVHPFSFQKLKCRRAIEVWRSVQMHLRHGQPEGVVVGACGLSRYVEACVSQEASNLRVANCSLRDADTNDFICIYLLDGCFDKLVI